jgi:type I restriction enzyme, S subunit
MKTILAEEAVISSLRLRPGDILFTEGGDRDKLGRGWVWNGEIAECIHQNHIFRARPNCAVIHPKFVSYHGNHFGQQWFVKTGKQTTNLASINKGVLRRFPVPVAPLSEHRRIVTKIEELFSDLDAGVAALERVKAKLKRYRAAVLKAAVEGRLTESWRQKNRPKETGQQLLDGILQERRRTWEKEQLAAYEKAGRKPPAAWKNKYKEPVAPDESSLPELPEGWCWASVGQLINAIEAGKSFECLKRKAACDEWGIIKVSAMTWGEFLEEEQKAIPLNAPFDPDSEIHAGDVLLSRSNTAELVGATVLVKQCRPKLLLSDKSMRLLVHSALNHTWFQKAMSSRVARKQMSAVATGTSDSMRNVSQEKVMVVHMPLPPFDEQAEIVEELEVRLSGIDAIASQISANLKRSARLRQSILRRAFEGKLVPQDPNDEPASVLLERIKARSDNIMGRTNTAARMRLPRRSSSRKQQKEN